jgi:hypothetical protein
MYDAIKKLDKMRQKAWQYSIDEAKKRTFLTKFIRTYIFYIFPAFSITYINFCDTTAFKALLSWEQPDEIPVWTSVFISAIVIEFIFLVIERPYRYIDSTHLYSELKDVHSGLNWSIKRIENNQQLSQILILIRENCQIVFLLSNENIDLSQYLDELFSPLIINIREIFDYNTKSYYNFSIYIFDNANKNLMCFYRARDKKFEREKNEESRSWPIGIGHVGRCFDENNSFIIKDVSKEEYFQKYKKVNDEKYYKSAISIPLNYAEKLDDGNTNIEFKCFGVMILTSSEPNQFSEYHLEVLNLLKSSTEDTIFKITKGGCHE